MNSYKALKKQIYISNQYSIVPIRMQDRHAIMNWRNEQIFHLRQREPLTKEEQDHYFNTTIASIYAEEEPRQILFSFLEEDLCIGYGGLVHINWEDKHAEVSFIMDTALEQTQFEHYWRTFIGLLDEVAFEQLGLHKIFTYAFDVRPHLYDALAKSGFVEEARLKEHCCFQNKFVDVLIHSKFQFI